MNLSYWFSLPRRRRYNLEVLLTFPLIPSLALHFLQMRAKMLRLSNFEKVLVLLTILSLFSQLMVFRILREKFLLAG